MASVFRVIKKRELVETNQVLLRALYLCYHEEVDYEKQ